MTGAADPAVLTRPDPDCGVCNGDGIDADPFNLLTRTELYAPCPWCWNRADPLQYLPHPK